MVKKLAVAIAAATLCTLLATEQPASAQNPQQTTFHHLFYADKIVDPNIAGYEYTIDKLLAQAPKEKPQTPQEFVEIMMTYQRIIDEKFGYKESDTYTEGLPRDSIDCDLRTGLFLSLGEVTGIQLEPVYIVPTGDDSTGHAFVRYHLTDTTYINWETTTGGGPSDIFYMLIYGIRDDDVREGRNLFEITKEEFISSYYLGQALRLLRKDEQKAMALLNLAEWHTTDCPYVHLFKADIYRWRFDHEQEQYHIDKFYELIEERPNWPGTPKE